jgi:hypothetical protein
MAFKTWNVPACLVKRKPWQNTPFGAVKYPAGSGFFSEKRQPSLVIDRCRLRCQNTAARLLAGCPRGFFGSRSRCITRRELGRLVTGAMQKFEVLSFRVLFAVNVSLVCKEKDRSSGSTYLSGVRYCRTVPGGWRITQGVLQHPGDPCITQPALLMRLNA